MAMSAHEPSVAKALCAGLFLALQFVVIGTDYTSVFGGSGGLLYLLETITSMIVVI